MVRISEEEARRLGLASEIPKQPKKRKYNNQPCEFNGLKFDSIKERDYYITLLDEEKRGEIYELERQIKLLIQPSFKTPDGKTEKAIYYIADFKYTTITDVGGGKHEVKTHYIDVKGGNATKTAVYKLKKKLLAYRGYFIEEV